MPRYYDAAKLRRAGVASSSFRDLFPSARSASLRERRRAPGLLDFPQVVEDRYLLHHVEFASPQLSTTDPQYLYKLRRRLEQAHSRLINVAIRDPALDAGGGLSARDTFARFAAVQAMKRWMDVARRLGAGFVSSRPGSINPADLTPTLKSCRELAAYGRLRRVSLLIENGPGADPGNIVDVIRESGSRVGALPDFGAFSSARARTAGLELLFPHAFSLCHADGVSFDAQGNETAFDFRACIEIAKRSRFRGIYCVRYDGRGDPYEGVQNVLNELIRYS